LGCSTGKRGCLQRRGAPSRPRIAFPTSAESVWSYGQVIDEDFDPLYEYDEERDDR
jgi:hypothetical protein